MYWPELKRISYVKRYSLLVLLIFFFHVFNNYAIIRADRTAIHADSMVYFQHSLACFRALTRVGPVRFVEAISRWSDKPPLFPVSILPFYALFGIGVDSACMANITYILILLVSIYLTGKMLADRFTGLLAAHLVMMYPTVFGLSRWCLSYFATLAMVTLTMLFLFRSRGFRDTKYSILAGLSAAAGALIHISSLFPVFVMYFFFIFFEPLPSSGISSPGSKRIRNFLISGMLAAYIFLVWWVANSKGVMEVQEVNDNFPRLEAVFRGFGRFMRILVDIQMHWFLTGVLALGSVFLAVRRTRLFIFLISIYVIDTLVFSSFVYSWTARFNIASFSALALITVLGIYHIPWPFVRRISAAMVFILSMVQFILISYVPAAGLFYRYMTPIVDTNRNVFDDQVTHLGLLRANRSSWMEDEIISEILHDRPEGRKGPSNVWVIFGKVSISGSLKTKIMVEELPIKIVFAPTCDAAQGRKDYNDELMRADILSSDYILTYRKRVFDCSKWPDFMYKADEVFRENRDRFEEVRRFIMPDGNTLHMYRNRGDG